MWKIVLHIYELIYEWHFSGEISKPVPNTGTLPTAENGNIRGNIRGKQTKLDFKWVAIFKRRFRRNKMSKTVCSFDVVFGWLVVFSIPSTAKSFRHLLSLTKDVKLDKYTVSTRNWTPGRRMALHHVTAALRKLHRLRRYWPIVPIELIPFCLPTFPKWEPIGYLNKRKYRGIVFCLF